MLELLLCSLLTIFPDHLYRRYRQGKRLGREINFFSVWFELRRGITACLMLTVGLITVIFYYHPSTTTATLYFRTVPILPEINGRVSEVRVDFSAPVKKGDVIFKLDSARQEAVMETSRRKIAEVDADLLAAQADVLKADAQIQQAKSDYQQASDELNVKRDLQQRSPGTVPQRDIEKLQVLLAGRQGALDSATASKQSRDDPLDGCSPRGESKRGGCTGRSTGGSGQDHYSCGSRRTRGAVFATRGRCRQSGDAVRRHSHS